MNQKLYEAIETIQRFLKASPALQSDSFEYTLEIQEDQKDLCVNQVTEGDFSNMCVAQFENAMGAAKYLGVNGSSLNTFFNAVIDVREALYKAVNNPTRDDKFGYTLEIGTEKSEITQWDLNGSLEFTRMAVYDSGEDLAVQLTAMAQDQSDLEQYATVEQRLKTDGEFRLDVLNGAFQMLQSTFAQMYPGCTLEVTERGFTIIENGEAVKGFADSTHLASDLLHKIARSK